ncbi:unnamed protein product [Sphagnum balticum]
MAAVQNPRHRQYECALYVRCSTQTTYVRRQDFMGQMSDMLDSAMCRANVARRQEIAVPLPADSKNAPPQREGKRQLDGVLRIKFSPTGIEQCEGEE